MLNREVDEQEGDITCYHSVLRYSLQLTKYSWIFACFIVLMQDCESIDCIQWQ